MRRPVSKFVGKTPDGPLFDNAGVAAAIVGAAFVLSVSLYWSGFGPGDPERYFRAAIAWTEQGFYLGDTHWSLRHPFVLPMAASFLIFGVSEFSATIPNIAYAGALAALTFRFARRYLGPAEGVLASIFIATSAFFVARPLELEVYGAEAFFAALACWLFVAAGSEDRRLSYLAAAGAAAGLSWAIREQTFYLMLVFGLLTLASRRDVVRSCLALGVGFGAIIAVELLFYLIAAGDPFYRYKVDLSHRTISVEVLIQGEDASLINTAIRPIRDLLTYPVTTPFLALAALAIWGLRRPAFLSTPTQRRSFIVFGVMSAIAIPICAYAFNLSFPRYYPILTYTAFLALGLAAAEIWRRHGRAAGVGFALLITLANAAAADFSRYYEYAEARYLADFAQSAETPIETDPLTASRVRHQLILRGIPVAEASRRVIATKAPPVGALFFKSHMTPRRKENWCAIVVADVRPTNWTHALIRVTGLNRIAGAKVREVTAKPRPVEIIRVLDRPALTDPATGQPCLPAT